MKYNILFTILFLSFISIASVEFSTGKIEATKKNGEGCNCHNLELNANVLVNIDGPSQILPGASAIYTITVSGGPGNAVGFNVAVNLGTLATQGSGSQVLFGELTHTEPKPYVSGSTSWSFLYTAPNTNEVFDTIYSVALSTNGDGIPNDSDQWNFGVNFPVHVTLDVPVELSSFTANLNESNVILNWTTVSEKNNLGFEVQKTDIRSQMTEWKVVGFVNGNGTTTELNNYYFNDNNVNGGINYYRLKQIDYDGSFEFSSLVEIDVNNSMNFNLSQNYPNPFNPSTEIRFQIPEDSKVSLIVYDILGNEIATLVNEFKSAGNYEIKYNAAELSSGIYLYKLTTGNFSSVKKMILTK